LQQRAEVEHHHDARLHRLDRSTAAEHDHRLVPAQQDVQAALLRLDELTRRLRRECPWDREQDERSIVPHTVEEAYELADAAHAGDDAKLIDELGDVLFQVHFLALLLEERGAGDLAAVADHCTEKLIRRHPHVFGDVEVAGAGEVLRNWDQIKRTQESPDGGLFGDLPASLPSLTLARKVQRRGALEPGSRDAALDVLREVVSGLAEAPDASNRELERRVGDLLFAATAIARQAQVDPELALRHATARFRDRVEAAAAANAGGGSWTELTPERRAQLLASQPR
jgi:MazG family protein